jgi:hypothetical protein
MRVHDDAGYPLHWVPEGQTPDSFGLIQGKRPSAVTLSRVTAACTVARRVSFVALVALAAAAAGLLAAAVAPMVMMLSAAALVLALASWTALACQKRALQDRMAGCVCPQALAADFGLVPRFGQAQALATQNSADTEAWREELVAAAEHNIIISGNYCAGKSFSRLLDKIRARMLQKRQLRCVILTSPNFLSPNMKRKLDGLKKRLGSRFLVIESDDGWGFGAGLKRVTNHTKCTVIDYGKYSILGGNGIKDNFAQVGLQTQTKEEFLAERLTVAREPRMDQSQASEEVDQRAEADDQIGGLAGMIARNLPGAFRDMDFVFRGSDTSGHDVYRQMLLLALKWHDRARLKRGGSFRSAALIDRYAAFNPNAAPRRAANNALEFLLAKPLPPMEQIGTEVPSFHQARIGAPAPTSVEIFSMTANHRQSALEMRLVKLIQEAQERIVINQMYFHPSDRVRQALLDAIRRGVRIRIITNGETPNCPNSHHVFGARNTAEVLRFAGELTEEQKERFEAFEFTQYKMGNHKKVVVIDDVVVAGSSNLGTKSLRTVADDEINFVAQSAELAAQTLAVCDQDVAHSRPIDLEARLSARERFKAFHHSLMGSLIG